MYRKLLYLSVFFFLGCISRYVYDAIFNAPPLPPLYIEKQYLPALEASLSQTEKDVNQNSQKFQELDKIYSQTFYYKNHGASTSAFLSEDGKYILKLFKMLDARTDEEVVERLAGYQLANDIRKKNTGIIFWHLYKTDHLKTSINIVDTIGINRRTKLGVRRAVDLDNYIFVIQHRAETMGTLLNNALRKGEVEKAKKYLREFFILYDDELKKGILDIDAKFFFNTGFFEGAPIRFDVSHLRQYEDGPSDKRVRKFKREALKHVIKWLQKRDYEKHTEIMQVIVIWLTKFPKEGRKREDEG